MYIYFSNNNLIKQLINHTINAFSLLVLLIPYLFTYETLITYESFLGLSNSKWFSFVTKSNLFVSSVTDVARHRKRTAWGRRPVDP